MARVISTFITAAKGTQYLANRELLSKIRDLLVPLGFTVFFDNLSTAPDFSYTSNLAVDRLSGYKLYTSAGLTTLVSQVVLSTPCDRFKIILFLGSVLDTSSYQESCIGSLLMVSGGVGDSTSRHPSMQYSMTQLSYSTISMSSSVYDYEIISLGNSFSIHCSKQGSTYMGFALAFYKAVPLTLASLPAVTLFNFSFSSASFLESLDNDPMNMSKLFALSDTLIGHSSKEVCHSSVNTSTSPLHQSIVMIETALLPAVWSNTGAYRLENLYFGRSTYSSAIIAGVIVLNSKQYRVLISTSTGFICYAID